jgi:hypothetical protein
MEEEERSLGIGCELDRLGMEPKTWLFGEQQYSQGLRSVG